MAFKMNRPIIKGTTHHKASIAKAKSKSESIVAQTRTQADAGLITAADAFGQSFSPKEIEYGTNMDAFKVPKGDDKKKVGKKKTKKEKTRKENLKEEYNKEHPDGTLFPNDDGGYQYYDADGKLVSNKVYDKDGNEVKKENRKVKRPKEEKVKEPKEKKDTWYSDVDEDGNVISRGYQSIKDKIKARREQKELDLQAQQEENLNERLKRAEEGPDSDYDFSELDNEPGLDAIKTEKYKSPEVSAKKGEELLSRTSASRNKALQDAAKKYNVKVEDLEAKEVGGKREFFPKQDVVGGKEETQWDDELGRFRNPEITAVVGKEAEKAAVEDMKPKYPEGMDPNLAKTGEIALNYDTNTYEYTQQYYDRLAKEKIEQQKVVEPVVEETTTEPVVEEKKTLSKLEIRKKKWADKKWNDPDTSQYVKDQMLKEGYVPDEGKTAMKMRDNRIYRNAIKGGIVQQNMIKSGYIPE
jgi:hypothetical protein